MSADATSTRRGVSAAEKYAELAALGQERPVCVCHGEPQGWHKRPRLNAGGHWQCVVQERERVTAYNAVTREKRIAYYVANRERILARKVAYRAANVEKLRAEYAAYYAANREKGQARNARQVRLGAVYVGSAATSEEAAEINQRLREKLFDFKAKQRSEYREVVDGWINAPVA